ncbi:MAG: NAD-dependent epimerase/dehydratase family protein, partial [Phaeodactylibacter sp.]|nr:NAD-dependent epimerase/dehydratase family protein [Phaeodactylibacter sp.]
LVTGGTGFVGAHLLHYLLEQGYTRIRAVRRADSDMRLVEAIAARIEWVEGDLADPFFVEEAVREVDCVLHCAAIVSFDPRDRKKMWAANITGTEHVVNFCLEHQVEKLVYLSFVAALGRRPNLGYIDEDTDWERHSNNSFYAVTKHRAEMEVWRAAAEGLSVAIANPSVVVGSGFWDRGTAKFFSNIWKGFPFYTNGGTGFVDVRDVARFLVLLLEGEVERERFVLNGANISYREFFNQIADQLGKKRPSWRVNLLIKALAWRFERIRSLLSGSRPIITRETAANSTRIWKYSAQKSRDCFDFQYTPIVDTITETCRQFIGPGKNGLQPQVLPFSKKPNA